MGVYNPKMKIPDSCWACPFCTEECFGAYKCFDVKDWGSREERAKDCPLIMVKAPHGRLVDVSEDATYDARYDHFDDHHMIVAQMMLDDLPTIIEAEGKDDG